jgi:hypothetical protein
MDEVQIAVPQIIADDIYVALCDAYERLPNGSMNLKRCINFFEKQRGYKPPEGYRHQV